MPIPRDLLSKLEGEQELSKVVVQRNEDLTAKVTDLTTEVKDLKKHNEYLEGLADSLWMSGNEMKSEMSAKLTKLEAVWGKTRPRAKKEEGDPRSGKADWTRYSPARRRHSRSRRRDSRSRRGRKRDSRSPSPRMAKSVKSEPRGELHSLQQAQPAWKSWQQQGRERIDIIVDSGASTSMLPRAVAASHPLKTGIEPKTYTTASQHVVKRDGEKDIVCGFMNGKDMRTTWEVGDIHRPLASVSRMVNQGHTVWFAPESSGGSWAYDHKTGEYIRIYERDGVYVMPAWIRPPAASAATGATAGFPRQAQP